MSAGTKLTKAAPWALETRLSSPEVSEKEERLAWALPHYHPSPFRETHQSSGHPPDLMEDDFPDTQPVFSPSCCLLPPILNTNAPPPACSYSFLGLVAQQAGSEKTKSPTNFYSWNTTWCKISVPHTRCITNTEGNICQALSLVLEKRETSSTCTRIILPIKSKARPWANTKTCEMCLEKMLHSTNN